MARHSGNRLRRGLARHKKASILVGTTVGLVAASTIAFAVTVLGGDITGTIQNNGAQPNVMWTDTYGDANIAPTLANGYCTTADGSTDTTATAAASLQTVSQATGEQQLVITLGSVYAGETCTFQGWLTDTGDTAVIVSGIDLNAVAVAADVGAGSGKVQEYPVGTAMNPSSLDLGAAGSGAPQQVSFTVTVPTMPAGNYTITGGLTLAPPLGWNNLNNNQNTQPG